MRINYTEIKIDNTQQNNKSRLWGDRDETVNLIISQRSKQAKEEYKSIHDRVGKDLHWELYKRLKFCHTDNC